MKDVVKKRAAARSAAKKRSRKVVSLGSSGRFRFLVQFTTIGVKRKRTPPPLKRYVCRFNVLADNSEQAYDMVRKEVQKIFSEAYYPSYKTIITD